MTESAVNRHLFVISDLHLGGSAGDGTTRGFSLFTRRDRLVDWIDEIREERPLPSGVHRELVINGDFLDFLSEEQSGPAGRRSWSPFRGRPENALEVLARILEEREPEVFAALRRFVSDGHDLTVIVGNHDLELSLPPVRRALAEALDPGTGGRFQLLYDGESYRVGDVIVEHGNRQDLFNQVDHDRLHAWRIACSRGVFPDQSAFLPPLGSRFVAETLNPIKERFRFVDLLQPLTFEGHSALILALDPSRARDLRQVAPLVARASSRWVGGQVHRLYGRFMGGDEERGYETDLGAGGPERGWRGDEEIPGAGAEASDDSLAEMWRDQLQLDEEVIRSLLEEPRRSALEESPYFADLSPERGEDFHEIPTRSSRPRTALLYSVLRGFAGRRRHRLDHETNQAFLDEARRLCDRPGISTVVFGHTHLPREVDLPGGGRYLNSGSWADYLELPNAFYDADPGSAQDRLADFVDDLEHNRLQDHIRCRPAAVELEVREGRRVSARTRLL